MNFNFLNSAVLWALPLSLLPVVFHLFLKKPPKKLPFGDLRFLSQVYQRHRPRRRLKEWLLLALRVLALAGLILFFSRPVLHWGAAAGSDSMAVAVLLDASASMRYQESGRSNWDRATELARRALGLMRENDRSSLIVFADDVRFLSGPLSNAHRETAKRLDELSPTYRSTRLLRPMQAAYQMLSNSGASNKAILVLSDMARTGWTAGSSSAPVSWETLIPSYDPAVRILYPELPKMRDNVSVQAVNLMADLRSQSLKAQVDLRNWSEGGVNGLPVFLERSGGNGADEARASETTVDLPPGASKTAVLTLSASEGRMEGWTGVRPDGFAADDRFYFARPPIRKVRVLCVEEHSAVVALSGESYYLRQALLAPPSPFEVRTVTLGELKQEDPDRYDAAVLVNPSEVDAENAEWLRRFVGSGRALFVSSGDRSAGQGLKSVADLLPCDLQGARDLSGQPVRVMGGGDEALSSFASDYDWSKVKIDHAVGSVLKEDARAWIQSGDGTPLLSVSGSGRVAVWAGTLDRSWGNFAAKPVFAPLMRFLLQALTAKSPGTAGEGRVVGDVYRRKASAAGARLLSPSGKRVELRPAGPELVSAPLEEPGLYGLYAEEASPVEVFSVNLDRRSGESDGARLSGPDQQALLPRTRWESLPADERYASALLTALRGRELSRPLLVFAGALLLAESWLSSRRRRNA